MLKVTNLYGRGCHPERNWIVFMDWVEGVANV